MRLSKQDFEQVDALQRQFPTLTRRVILLVYRQNFGRTIAIMSILAGKEDALLQSGVVREEAAAKK